MPYTIEIECLDGNTGPPSAWTRGGVTLCLAVEGPSSVCARARVLHMSARVRAQRCADRVVCSTVWLAGARAVAVVIKLPACASVEIQRALPRIVSG